MEWDEKVVVMSCWLGWIITLNLRDLLHTKISFIIDTDWIFLRKIF